MFGVSVPAIDVRSSTSPPGNSAAVGYLRPRASTRVISGAWVGVDLGDDEPHQHERAPVGFVPVLVDLDFRPLLARCRHGGACLPGDWAEVTFSPAAMPTPPFPGAHTARLVGIALEAGPGGLYSNVPEMSGTGGRNDGESGS